jgi:DNA-binding MarR family transcriptional regulator
LTDKSPAVPASAELGTEALYRRNMLGHLIFRCHQISVALFQSETSDLGITAQQYVLLRALSEHDGVDQITLAGLVAFNRTTTGDVVGRLETAGLLRREDSKEDRRAKVLFITPAGRRMLQRVLPAEARGQERLLAPLKPKEQEQFIGYLARIVRVNNDLSRAPHREAKPTGRSTSAAD